MCAGMESVLVKQNAHMLEENTQGALSRIESTFGIPKDAFVNSVLGGTHSVLISNAPLNPLPSELLAQAKGNVDHESIVPTPTPPPPLYDAPRSPASTTAKESLQAKLRKKLEQKLDSDPDENEGLTPLDDFMGLEQAQRKEVNLDGLDLFQVVHRKYNAVFPTFFRK